jgi:peptide/nickel transport system permease protein
MTSLWRLVCRRGLQLVFSLALFVYIICMIADARFMAIDRIDIEYACQLAISDISKTSNPPLPPEESTRLLNEFRAAAAKRYGFDKPFLIRVQMRVARLFTEGFGQPSASLPAQVAIVQLSMHNGKVYSVDRDIGHIIGHAAIPTLVLFGGAFLTQVAIAFYLGLWCARRPGSILDRSTTVAGFLGASIPPIAMAGIVVSLFVVALRVFPGEIWKCRWPSGWSNVGPWLGDFLSYYLLPYLTLVVLGFGPWAIQFRNLAVDVNKEDFVQAARARGMSERRVVYGHIARATSPPIVSAIVMGLATSMFGAMFVEPLFHWPGLGTLFWKSIQYGADRLVFGIMLVMGAAYSIASFSLELIYGYLDPRIRSGTR